MALRRHLYNWPLFLAMLALSGCSWAPPRAEQPTASVAGAANWGVPATQPAYSERVVNAAVSMMGAPYRWGGDTPAGFDCSGLVYYSFDMAGLQVPRTSRDQFRRAQPVPLGAARPGDLVFFASGKKISHVGIYLGDDEFIHAPEAGQNVKISSIREDYYRAHFAGAGRLAQR
jgi:cell wall-associated NlpC family hydrolase